MKRDVNLLLFTLLILLLVAMVAMTIYAQQEYQHRDADYLTALRDITKKDSLLDNRSVELNKTRDELERSRRELVDLIKELNISEEREVSLGGLFEGLKGEKELLKEDLETTAGDRDKWRSNYTMTQSELSMCEKDYELKVRQLDLAEEKISGISRNVKYLKINVNKSKDYVGDIEDHTDDIDDELASLHDKVGDVEDKALRDELEDDIGYIQDIINDKLKETITDLKKTLNSMEKQIKELD